MPLNPDQRALWVMLSDMWGWAAFTPGGEAPVAAGWRAYAAVTGDPVRVVDWPAALPALRWRPPLAPPRPLLILGDPVRPGFANIAEAMNITEAIRWDMDRARALDEARAARNFAPPPPPLFPPGREPRGWSGMVWPRQHGELAAAATWPDIGPRGMSARAALACAEAGRVPA